jgi:hypothetical protein
MPVYSSTLGRMSQAPRRTAIALIAALTAVVMSGCGAPAPTPTPTALSEAEAYAAAEATYRAYVDALNRVDLSDPTTFDAVFAMTSDELNSTDRQQFSQMHADGTSAVGDVGVFKVSPLDWDVTSSRAQLGVCLDVSRTDIVDRSGVSLLDPNRPKVQAVLASLFFAEVGSQHATVSSLESWDAAQCS